MIQSKKALGLAFVASLLALAAFASSAFAATSQWLAGGKVITTAEGPLAKDSEGELVIEEMNTGAKVTCTETLDKGTVGPGAADTVTAVEFKGCKGEGACSTFESMTLNHLPWATEVVLLEDGTFMDDILSSGAGSPGYTVVCKILGIKVISTCELELTFVNLENLVGPPPDVDALFNTEETALCNTSNAETGLIHGTELILLVSGEGLSVSEA